MTRKVAKTRGALRLNSLKKKQVSFNNLVSDKAFFLHHVVQLQSLIPNWFNADNTKEASSGFLVKNEPK